MAKVAHAQPAEESRTEACLARIHIVIESPDRTTAATPRLPKYWRALLDFAVNTFRYLDVGLPGRNADDYRHGENWLGVALSALVRCPKDKLE